MCAKYYFSCTLLYSLTEILLKKYVHSPSIYLFTLLCTKHLIYFIGMNTFENFGWTLSNCLQKGCTDLYSLRYNMNWSPFFTYIKSNGIQVIKAYYEKKISSLKRLKFSLNFIASRVESLTYIDCSFVFIFDHLFLYNTVHFTLFI